MLTPTALLHLATRECRGAPVRKRHFTYMKFPRHERSRFGGRAVRVSSTGQLAPQHLRDPRTKTRMLAVYEAQEFSRRRWKGRDYEVYELPFSLAPKELQRVVPELHTECPLRAGTDGTNLRHKVYERSALPAEVFGNGKVALPVVPKVTNKCTFDKMYVF